MSEIALQNAALLPWLIAGVGAFGLLIGSFLNVVVWRVPRGESLLPDSHCPRCNAAIRPWQNIPVLSWLLLRGTCANCGARISVRYPLVELGTGVAFSLVTWWFVSALGFPGAATSGAVGAVVGDTGADPGVAALVSGWCALAAYLWLASASIALALIDLDHQRLPDAIVLPSLGVVTTLLVASALLMADWPRLIATLGGAAVLFGIYLVIAVVYPAGIGGGDVKLAPLLGAALGSVGWGSVAVGGFAGFLLGACFGLGLIALRRGTRKTGIPFGPFMLLGAWIGLVLGERLMGAYLSLVGLV